MNGAVLLIPFLLIRFVLPAFLDKSALRRAAHFAPMQGGERAAYWVYQISNAAIFIYLFFLTINTDPPFRFYSGLTLYLAGLCLCCVSIVNFSYPSDNGMNMNGIYRFSRNPMYVSYFVCFIGAAALTGSLILFGIALIFQISAHWIVLAEERECIDKFGAEYERYMKRVRCYI